MLLHIYLADGSVAAEIVFGVTMKNFDQNAIEHAVKIANPHELVVKDLPQGYANIVGTP